MARLRALTEHYEFGDSLNTMLRDRLLCGVNNEQLQHQLQAEPHLTFTKAMEISQTFKTMTEEARMLQCDASSAESLAVNVLLNTNTADTTIRQTANQMPTNPYYQFGETHPAAKCRFKQAKCHKCNKNGYIMKVCRSSQAGMVLQRQEENHPVHQVEHKEPFQQWVFQRLWLLTMGRPLQVMSLQNL